MKDIVNIKHVILILNFKSLKTYSNNHNTSGREVHITFLVFINKICIK
jgi:hypothetical protein